MPKRHVLIDRLLELLQEIAGALLGRRATDLS
jgi:hypothetical protein